MPSGLYTQWAAYPDWLGRYEFATARPPGHKWYHAVLPFLASETIHKAAPHIEYDQRGRRLFFTAFAWSDPGDPEANNGDFNDNHPASTPSHPPADTQVQLNPPPPAARGPWSSCADLACQFGPQRHSHRDFTPHRYSTDAYLSALAEESEPPTPAHRCGPAGWESRHETTPPSSTPFSVAATATMTTTPALPSSSAPPSAGGDAQTETTPETTPETPETDTPQRKEHITTRGELVAAFMTLLDMEEQLHYATLDLDGAAAHWAYIYSNVDADPELLAATGTVFLPPHAVSALYRGRYVSMQREHARVSSALRAQWASVATTAECYGIFLAYLSDLESTGTLPPSWEELASSAMASVGLSPVWAFQLAHVLSGCVDVGEHWLSMWHYRPVCEDPCSGISAVLAGAYALIERMCHEAHVPTQLWGKWHRGFRIGTGAGAGGGGSKAREKRRRTDKATIKAIRRAVRAREAGGADKYIGVPTQMLKEHINSDARAGPAGQDDFLDLLLACYHQCARQAPPRARGSFGFDLDLDVAGFDPTRSRSLSRARSYTVNVSETATETATTTDTATEIARAVEEYTPTPTDDADADAVTFMTTRSWAELVVPGAFPRPPSMYNGHHSAS